MEELGFELVLLSFSMIFRLILNHKGQKNSKQDKVMEKEVGLVNDSYMKINRFL